MECLQAMLLLKMKDLLFLMENIMMEEQMELAHIILQMAIVITDHFSKV